MSLSFAQDNQRELLAVLLKAARDPAFPFRILVASRSEVTIEKFFSDCRTTEHVAVISIDDQKYQQGSREDVSDQGGAGLQKSDPGSNILKPPLRPNQPITLGRGSVIMP